MPPNTRKKILLWRTDTGMFMCRAITVMCAAIVLTACTLTPHQGRNASPPVVEVASQRIELDNTDTVIRILKQQHHEWQQVPYRTGGLSRDGIDCSGLVYRTFRSKFGIDVPRSTEYQSRAGSQITRQQLQAGDLVFFKTGYNTRHVGMYIEKGNFLHASSSKGVMISSLDNPYWSHTYWKAQRLR